MFKNKIRTAWSLSPSEWVLLARSWFLLGVVDLGLRTMQFARMQSFAEKGSSTDLLDDEEAKREIQRISQIVDIASRNHLYPMTCLRRSLTLQRLLSQKGITTQLCFGVLKENGELKAHAWLAYEGTPIGEPEKVSQRFLELSTKQAQNDS